MAGRPQIRIPGRHLALALGLAGGRALTEEWRLAAARRGLAPRGRAVAFALQPRNFRPVDEAAGRAILAGVLTLSGQTLPMGVGGDPWNRPLPGRPFAEALHRFDWLPHLVAAAPEGAAEALRLVLEWRRTFGRGNAFAWAPEIMSRRVYHLACAAPSLAARASEAETAQIAADLARQARMLLGPGDLAGAAERAAAAAIAGATLGGPIGRRLLDRALRRLAKVLPLTVSADGGHATRRPDLALELLFDLQTLDDALVERGLAASDAFPRAIGHLAAAVRFFTLQDGRLAAVQGGAAPAADYVAAARAQDETGDRPTPAELGGYHRLDCPAVQLVADADLPADGSWSRAACDHPAAIQVLVGGRRLIDAGVFRAIEGAATVQVGERGLAHVLSGWTGNVLGSRLVDAAGPIEVQRHEAPGALWLDIAHHGWAGRFGLMHQRRLYLDLTAGELRGEDRLTPTARAQGPDGRHFVAYTLRFPLHAGVQALVSQDRRSVLLRPEGAAEGWVLRNDSLDIEIERAPGPAPAPLILTLRGRRRADSGSRVRWKLAPARSAA